MSRSSTLRNSGEELGDPSSESSHISECPRDPQLMEERGRRSDPRGATFNADFPFFTLLFSHFSRDRTLIHVLFSSPSFQRTRWCARAVLTRRRSGCDSAANGSTRSGAGPRWGRSAPSLARSKADTCWPSRSVAGSI